MKIIRTESAPAALGPYSQAVQIDKFIFSSGQIGLRPGASDLCSANFSDQATQVFDNLLAVAQAAGGDLSKVIKLTVFLKDLNNFSELNEIMENYFVAPFPARSTVQVAKLPKDALVEVEMIMSVC